MESMGKSLIIVESPAKIKTLKKFLGPDFIFAACYGHVRDLPQKGFGIDTDNDFEPIYEILPDKKQVITDLKKAAKECDTVYLSPDPDREGEAIAWHIASILPPTTNIKRTAFHAITKESVTEALAHPREIDLGLVNAQQARRLLDRIVGYKISPLLARKLQKRSGVSAGRVQSVALKLVVDREIQIEEFKSVEYWNLGALLKDGDPSKQFSAFLYSVDGVRWEKEEIEGKKCLLLNNEKDALVIKKKLEEAKYSVGKVEKKEKLRNPQPPFITSTLQQEASRHYRFSSQKTMSVAQSLYEGVDLDNDGAEGLITYMRTDSVRTEPVAISAARAYIEKKYGKEYLPETPKYYTSKKSAQDAHEAIRPTNMEHPPERIKRFLTIDQFNLYSLIWKRFITSQMNSAIYDTVSATIETDKGLVLRATGSTIKFRGFLALYEEKKDEVDSSDEDKILPPLEEGHPLHLIEATCEQAFTKPPPRFTEALLVKELEKSGIGRPSTYASIMGKIQGRSYTIKENNRLKPTELGRVIAQFLETNFQMIMNIGFTAEMEDTLELIASNEKEWKEVIRSFWNEFNPVVEAAKNDAFIPKLDTELLCPKCKEANLQKIWSKSGYFYGCARYPECDYTTSDDEMKFDKALYAEDFDWEQKCPLCTKEMKLRHGRYGAFLGCTGYPDCKGLVSIPKKGETIVVQENIHSCPAIGCDGKIVARRSRFGKTFYSCTHFPECDVIVNNESDLEKKYENHPKTAYVKKAGGKGGNRFNKELKLSKELATVVGADKLSRGQVTKKIWEYIKANGCQDPSNKRKIIPDENLAKVFGSKEPVDMFQMASILSKHFK